MTRVLPTALFASLVAASASAQQDQIDALREEVRDLRTALIMQRDTYEEKLRRMQDHVDASANKAREEDLAEKVADQVRFYTRTEPERLYPNRGIFSSLQGGLFFTGLFRSRFEARHNNVDFNPSSTSGLDDSGIGFNGRFRLGFGAVLFKEGGKEQAESGRAMQVTALTEFQSYGTFANNSYVSTPSPSGLPVPFAFSILTEPFENVGIYQGYLEFQRLIDENINIKVGRQELVFGNEFLLGNNSFYEGTVHDAFYANWDRRYLSGSSTVGFRMNAVYAKEAASDGTIAAPSRNFDEDELVVLYGEGYPGDDWQIDAYGVYFNARSTSPDLFVTGSTAFIFDGALTPPILGHHWTLGTRIFKTFPDVGGGPLSLNLEAAYQFGDDTSLAAGPRKISGAAAEFIATWRIPPTDSGLRPIATLAYLYSEGGEPATIDGPGALGFQPLYVNRHFENLVGNAREDTTRPYYPGGGRYGNMDEIPLFNVHAFKLAMSVEAAPRVEVGLAYILALTADDQGYGTGLYGHEADIFGTYVYSNTLQFSANVGVFFPGRTATALSNALFFNSSVGSKFAGDEPAFSAYIQALLQF